MPLVNAVDAGFGRISGTMDGRTEIGDAVCMYSRLEKTVMTPASCYVSSLAFVIYHFQDPND